MQIIMWINKELKKKTDKPKNNCKTAFQRVIILNFNSLDYKIKSLVSCFEIVKGDGHSKKSLSLQKIPWLLMSCFIFH